MMLNWIRTYTLALIGGLMLVTAACDMLTPEQEQRVLQEVKDQESEGLLTPAEANFIRELVEADDEVPWQEILLTILGAGAAYFGIQLRGVTGGSNAALLREILAQARKRKIAEDVATASEPSLLDSNAGQPTRP